MATVTDNKSILKNKTILYAGFAATAGIVGYAWFTKSGSEEELVDLVPTSGERIPPTTVNSSLVSVDTRTGLKSNADWQQLAIERLMNIGINGPAASSAIGKFLQRLPLNAAEADLVRQAIGAAGNPPEGGPWTVIPEPTPAAVAMGKPGNFRAQVNNKNASLTWDAVTGASGYELTKSGGLTVRQESTSFIATDLTNGSHTYTVKAYNSANNYGEVATVTFDVSTSGSMPTIDLQAAPQRDSILWHWTPIPGVNNYVVMVEMAAHKYPAFATTNPGYYQTGLQPNGSYGLHVTAQDANGQQVAQWSRLVTKTLP